MKINIDMDGVVADFAKFASEQLGVTIKLTVRIQECMQLLIKLQMQMT